TFDSRCRSATGSCLFRRKYRTMTHRSHVLWLDSTSILPWSVLIDQSILPQSVLIDQSILREPVLIDHECRRSTATSNLFKRINPRVRIFPRHRTGRGQRAE